jgi:hypothetical protein
MSGIEIRGGASAEDIAAVLAAVTRSAPAPAERLTGLQAWRAGRVAALRRSAERR